MAFKDPHAPIETIPIKLRGAFGRWRKIMLMPMAERFWKRAPRNKPDECWPYFGEINETGYGIFTPFQKHKGRQLAHRMAWMLEKGPIPEGLYVCHKCDNPRCCNPNHLFVGTQFDNMRDCSKKGRCNPARGEKNWSAKLTTEQVIQIRAMYRPGIISHSDIAKLFGVHKCHIQGILTRRKWKHVN